MNITKIIYFLKKTTLVSFILWLSLSVLCRNSIDLLFVLVQIYLLWLTIPIIFGCTYSIDLYVKKLELDKSIQFKLLKLITVPVSLQKFFCVSYRFSGKGKLLWVSFVFQLSWYVNTLISMSLCGLVISKVLFDLKNMRLLSICAGFWLSFFILFGATIRIVCFSIELYCKYKDGENIKKYFFSIHKIDFKEYRESKKLANYIMRRSIIVEELCKKGLYHHKKKYCIKEKDLTEFEKIIETQYPDLRYDVQHQSKETLLVVYERESDAVIFKAVVKKIK